MADLAYQVTNFAYQGAGLFAYQGSVDSAGTTDTHDGVDDEDIRRRVREKDDSFKSARDRLREALRMAWDGPGEAATEVRAIASPFVEILESGAMRVDYAAMEAKNEAVMREVLAFTDSLRAEYERRLLDDDDEDVMLLTWVP